MKVVLLKSFFHRFFSTFCYCFVSPAKQGRHIGITIRRLVSSFCVVVLRHHTLVNPNVKVFET